MLHIVNLEEIQKILLHTSTLVNLYALHDPKFTGEVKQWLGLIQNVLEKNNIAISGSVSSLLGVLISAERGAVPKIVELSEKISRRKTREAIAIEVIRQTNDLVSNAIRKDQERFVEAESIMRQLVSIGKAKGLINERPTGINLTEKLRALWRKMAVDPDLKGGTVNVEGLIGPQDALIVLDRTITSDILNE